MKTSLSVVLLALGLSACQKAPEPVAALRPALVVTVGGVAAGNARAYAGEVRARYEVDLAFRVGGKLIERRVNLGERVRKGQLLASLDPADLRLSATAAAAQLAATEADLALARTEYERAQTLVAQKFISSSALDARRTQFEAAQARRAQAQATHDVAQNQSGYASLVAPRDGVVTAAPVEAGQVVAAGQSVLRIADPAEREVLVWIPEARVSGLKPGALAQVQVWSQPGKTYAGVLRELAASADAATRTYAARISVKDADEALSLGATAAAAFAGDAGAGAIELPLAAVMRGEQERARVWVVDAQDQVQAREVVVARWQDDRVVLASGVQAGERVVSVGAHALSPGQKVRPLEQGAPVVLDVTR